MENIIKPDRKLFTKQWLILLTLSVLILFMASLLQILLPLDKELNPADVGRILWPIAFLCIAFLWILLVPILTLWVKNLKYVLEEDRIIIHKGILTKVRKNIPYRAVTDFVLYRSLYDRFLGIASIRIQTAGQSQSPTGYEGNMAGLADWNTLHTSLRNKVRSLHPFSESLGIKEPLVSQEEKGTLIQILEELKAIRKALEK
jgi:uncharacterized membrane protein YdbT with pleckstrin-like domain